VRVGFGIAGGAFGFLASGSVPRLGPAGGISSGVVTTGGGDGNKVIGKVVGLIIGAGITFHGELLIRADSVITLLGRSEVSTGVDDCILRLSR